MENCVFNHVNGVEFFKTGIQDIDMSNHPTLTWLGVKGDTEEFGGDYELNWILSFFSAEGIRLSRKFRIFAVVKL